MTETVYTHKQAAVRKPVRLVCFMRCASARAQHARLFYYAPPSRERVSHAVDTHEFQTPAALESVLRMADVGVHAYPQISSTLQVCTLPLASRSTVYTHKPARQYAGQHGHWAADVCGLLQDWFLEVVYTHKQLPPPMAQRPAPRRGQRRLTQSVYTYKHPTEPRPERGSVRLGLPTWRSTMT